MAPSTARYQYSGFYYGALQDNNSGSIRTTELFYPNKIEPDTNVIDIPFEGGDQRRHVYMLAEYTLTLDQDCLDLNAMSIVFGKNKVTSISDTPYATEYTWMGDTDEGGGASVGGVFKAHAIKNVAGVESAVDIVLWVPVATLTLARHAGLTTLAKGTFPQFKLSSNRTTVNIVGGTLSGVPTNGAFYSIGE